MSHNDYILNLLNIEDHNIYILNNRKFSFGSPFFLKNGIKFVYSIIYLMFLCSFEGGIENENMETYE